MPVKQSVINKKFVSNVILVWICEVCSFTGSCVNYLPRGDEKEVLVSEVTGNLYFRSNAFWECEFFSSWQSDFPLPPVIKQWSVWIYRRQFLTILLLSARFASLNHLNKPNCKLQIKFSCFTINNNLPPPRWHILCKHFYSVLCLVTSNKAVHKLFKLSQYML